MCTVPNQPKYDATPIRMPPELKKAFREKAQNEGSNMTEVAVRLIKEYVNEKAPESQEWPEPGAR